MRKTLTAKTLIVNILVLLLISCASMQKNLTVPQRVYAIENEVYSAVKILNDSKSQIQQFVDSGIIGQDIADTIIERIKQVTKLTNNAIQALNKIMMNPVEGQPYTIDFYIGYLNSSLRTIQEITDSVISLKGVSK